MFCNPIRPMTSLERGHFIFSLSSVSYDFWEGRPYCTKWSWRKEVIAHSVTPVLLFSWGIQAKDYFLGPILDSKWLELDWLAELDFIEPPTGQEMGRLFNSMYKLSPIEGKKFQIIRW